MLIGSALNLSADDVISSFTASAFLSATAHRSDFYSVTLKMIQINDDLYKTNHQETLETFSLKQKLTNQHLNQIKSDFIFIARSHDLS